MQRSASILSRPGPALVLLLNLLALAGCSGNGGEEVAGPTADCPVTSVLSGAGRLSEHLPGEPRRSQTLRYVAAITGLESTCRYGADGLAMDLSFGVVAEPGPAFEGRPLDLEVFLATVGPDDAILSKDLLRVQLAPARGGGPIGEMQTLTLALPVASPGEARARRLFVGFQSASAAPAARPERLLR